MAIDDKERIHFRGRGPRGERKARKLNALVDMIQKAAPAKAGHVNVRVRQTEGGSVFSAKQRTPSESTPSPLSFRLPDLDDEEEPTLREAIEQRYIGDGTVEEPQRMPKYGQILSGQSQFGSQRIFVTYIVAPRFLTLAPDVVVNQKIGQAAQNFEVGGFEYVAVPIDCSNTRLNETEEISSFPYNITRFEDIEIIVTIELTVTNASQHAEAVLVLNPGTIELDRCELDAVITNPTTTNPNFTLKTVKTLRYLSRGSGSISVGLNTSGTVSIVNARAIFWKDGYDYASAVK